MIKHLFLIFKRNCIYVSSQFRNSRNVLGKLIIKIQKRTSEYFIKKRSEYFYDVDN